LSVISAAAHTVVAVVCRYDYYYY